MARALRAAFPNVEVYLFGSLTTEMFELESDIDIAVKGLLEEHYYKAYRIAEDIVDSLTTTLLKNLSEFIRFVDKLSDYLAR